MFSQKPQAFEVRGSDGKLWPYPGVDSVVAGSNVTVDNTDPANPIVASTGGGGTIGDFTLAELNDPTGFSLTPDYALSITNTRGDAQVIFGAGGEAVFTGTQTFFGFASRSGGYAERAGMFVANRQFFIYDAMTSQSQLAIYGVNGNTLLGSTEVFPNPRVFKLEVNGGIASSSIVNCSGTINDGGTTATVGTDTAFTSELIVGDYITLDYVTFARVTSILDDINLTTDVTLNSSDNSFNGVRHVFSIDSTGVCLTYDGKPLVGNGIPSSIGKVDLTAQSAAITATTLLAVMADGYYRVSWVATVTRAATTSCVLGGTNGFQLKYTDADDSVVKTSNPTTVTKSAVNATGTSISGTCVAYCKAGTNLQYLMDYTSVGGTSMQYNLHAICERL